MNGLHWVVTILLIIGGLSWGLIGLFDFNIVTSIFGMGTILTDIIYILIGAVALYSLYETFAMKK